MPRHFQNCTDARQAAHQRKNNQRSSKAKPGPKPGSKRFVPPPGSKPAAFYVPTDLDLHKLLGDHAWHGAYLLNLIRWRQITWRADNNGFSRLKYEYLTGVLPKPIFRTVCDRLLAAGVLQRDSTYSTGSKALGYRITDAYQTTHRIVCDHAELNRKIAQAQVDQERNHLPVHHWLKAHLAALNVDLHRAEQIIATLQNDDGKIPIEKYHSDCTTLIGSIAKKEHYLSVDEYGRVHTKLTTLNNELLPCLSVFYDGKHQPLVEIDLCNAQPLLLCWFANYLHNTSRNACANIINHKFSNKNSNPYDAAHQRLSTLNSVNTPSLFTTIPTILPYYEVIRRATTYGGNGLGREGGLTFCADLAQSFAACEQGIFYETLLTDEERSSDLTGSRKRVKGQLWHVLFGKNSAARRGVGLRFVQRHPELYATLRRLKRRNYKHSSHLLQNLEATLFVYRVCGRLLQEHPDVPVLTKHDCILTVPGHAAVVAAIIMEEFAKVGLRTTLKQKVHG